MGGDSSKNKNMSVFTNTLAVPPEFGHSFVFSGRIRANAQRFEINFATDKTLRDVPLHLSFRLPEGLLVRNTKTNNFYDEKREERNTVYPNLRFPYRAGDQFTIYVLVGSDRFHISLNSQHYCDYIYRGPINSIRTIHIDKDVEKLIQVDHRRVFPYTYPAIQTKQAWFCFSNDIPVQFKPGHVIVLSANTFGKPSGSFSIRFMIGHTDKTGFVFTARFPPAGVVVRNHTNNDKGEFNPREEERQGGFPFTLGRPFKMAIGLTDKNFRVAIDGKFFCDFNFRGRIEQFTGIKCSENDGMLLQINDIENHFIDPALRTIEQLSR